MVILGNIFFQILIFLSIMELSIADDMITLAKPIKDGETLVSSSQTFELGFFSPGNPNHRFLGIWYKNISKQVVWVANRNNPITDPNGVLAFNSDGNIALFDGTNTTVWSSNVLRKPENPVAQLLDSGNFVIIDDKKNKTIDMLWQSFDNPTDTILQGMKIGKNLKTGTERFLTAWRSSDDPSPGNFTFRLNIQDLLLYLSIMNGSTKVYRTGLWDGTNFGGTLVSPNLVSMVTVIQNENEIYYMYEPYNNPIIMRVILNPYGFLQRLIWNERSTKWDSVFRAPIDQCGQYGLCGANSICRINNNSNEPICDCLAGFRLDRSKKCVKRRPDCEEGNQGYFLKLAWVKLPDLIDFKFNKSMNLKECEVECSKNCSCSAYSSVSIDEHETGCLMWYGDLIDMVDEAGKIKGPDIYVRVPSSELGSGGHASSNKKRIEIIIVISITCGIIVIFGLVFCLVLRRKWRRGKDESWKENLEIPLFDLATIYTATNSFSEPNLIGVGGFGSVYKGILPTGQEIAVKRLSKDSEQGVEEFRNEVVLIAKLQQRNLVGLCGICIEGKERLLVYEYMSNKSLDYFIFDDDRRVLLGWPKRFDIIMQIVRGLLYLHQDSKLQIIHRDLKASNILLDTDMNAKISDFGLARIFEGDDISVTKRVVGTFGYMPPEYAAKGKFSTKSDVYSLGVLLLELISGQKNRSFHHPNHHNNLLGHAWLLWNEGRAMELVDSCLEDSIVESQVVRCIQVGLLCAQNCPKDRPTMLSVNFMLGNEEAMLPQPKEPGFFTDTETTTTTTKENQLHTANLVTMTMVEAR